MKETIREEARDTPVHGRYDVIVCGGGPAGIAAALSSARNGARTLILESQGCLGGVWTAGLLSWVVDGVHKGGIMAELVELLDQERLRTVNQDETYGHAFDPEMMKRLLERLCLDAGVAIRLHTMITGGVVDDAGRVTHAITESKSGREAWAARVFIDCSGEGDFAARCGCGFDMGHPDTGQTQPFSLLGIIAGPGIEEFTPFLSGWKDWNRSGESKQRINQLLEAAGVPPSYSRPTMMPIHDGLYMLMANHEYGVSAINADDISAATIRARAEVHTMIDALQKTGGAWGNARLVATGEQIGLREGRRIHGLYQVTVDDVIAGARHDDGVCLVRAPIDVHSLDPKKSKSHYNAGVKQQAYEIPLRALIAKDVKGLMMAGRCISGDFLAHSSYRVTGDAVALGEAAGLAAATAVGNDLPPSQLPFAEIACKLQTISYAGEVRIGGW